MGVFRFLSVGMCVVYYTRYTLVLWLESNDIRVCSVCVCCVLYQIYFGPVIEVLRYLSVWYVCCVYVIPGIFWSCGRSPEISVCLVCVLCVCVCYTRYILVLWWESLDICLFGMCVLYVCCMRVVCVFYQVYFGPVMGILRSVQKTSTRIQQRTRHLNIVVGKIKHQHLSTNTTFCTNISALYTPFSYPNFNAVSIYLINDSHTWTLFKSWSYVQSRTGVFWT
jgi:hypothetical protein